MTEIEDPCRSGSRDPERAKVLVADDDGFMQRMVRDVLSDAGFRVVGARDGREALDTIAEWDPDAAVVDALMPKVDGREICREIRSDPGQRKIVLVLYTGLREKETEWLEVGADAFVSKRDGIGGLAGLIRKLLAERRGRPADDRDFNTQNRRGCRGPER